LKVREETGQSFEVRIDGAVVGTTPWEGTIAAGEHAVSLVGRNDTGAPAKAARVEPDAKTELTLRGGLLDGDLHVEPTPTQARVSLDGRAVAVGTWSGRASSGSHEVEVLADWYEPARLPVAVSSEQPVIVRPVLVPIRRLYFELFVGESVHPVYSTIGVDGCGQSCGGLMYGVRGGYLLSPHLGVEIFFVSSMNDGRQSTSGQAIAMSTSVGGASASLRYFDRWPLTLRLAAGAVVGSATPVAAVEQEGAQATPFWAPVAGPEVRFGWRITRAVMVDGGIGAWVFMAPKIAPVQNPPLSTLPGVGGGAGVLFPATIAVHADF
jgi:hypothetical protein